VNLAVPRSLSHQDVGTDMSIPIFGEFVKIVRSTRRHKHVRHKAASLDPLLYGTIMSRCTPIRQRLSLLGTELTDTTSYDSGSLVMSLVECKYLSKW
jgi:hypothetical protein